MRGNRIIIAVVVTIAGCAIRQPLARKPEERVPLPVAPKDHPPVFIDTTLTTLAPAGHPSEVRWLAEALNDTDLFGMITVAPGVSDDPTALVVRPLDIQRFRPFFDADQPWLLLALGVIPIGESDDKGIYFILTHRDAHEVHCPWPVDWWLGWPTLLLNLSSQWTFGFDREQRREAFLYEMRRCLLSDPVLWQ